MDFLFVWIKKPSIHGNSKLDILGHSIWCLYFVSRGVIHDLWVSIVAAKILIDLIKLHYMVIAIMIVQCRRWNGLFRWSNSVWKWSVWYWRLTNRGGLCKNDAFEEQDVYLEWNTRPKPLEILYSRSFHVNETNLNFMINIRPENWDSL